MLYVSLLLPAYAANNIIIVGDSLSAGYGFDPQKSWPQLLQKKLQEENLSYKVINLSISGSTTSNGLAVLPKAIKTYHPKITIIALGGNDGLRGLDISTIKQNLQKMIDMAKPKSKIILAGVRLPPNYGPDYTKQFQMIFDQLAEKNRITLVPLLLKNVDDKPNLIQPDGIHPTQEAQPIILQNVLDKLKI